MSEAPAPQPPGRDAGFSLAEVLVASAVFAVVMLMFGIGLTQMYGLVGRTEAMQVAQSSMHDAIQRIGGQIRYSSSIADPAGGAYVEVLTTSAGTAHCAQLRLDADRLQNRTWPAGAEPPENWFTLVEGVTGHDGHPFVRIDAEQNGHQRLTVQLATPAPEGGGPSRPLDFTFTALNSTAESPAPTQCSRYRP